VDRAGGLALITRRRRATAREIPGLNLPVRTIPKINQTVFFGSFFKLTHYPDLTLEHKGNILPERPLPEGKIQMSSAPNQQSDADQLEAAADQAIAACGGDAREAVKALIVANHFLETDLEKLKAAASTVYARGALSTALPIAMSRGRMPGVGGPQNSRRCQIQVGQMVHLIYERRTR
jgi:hypothetical protein